jgi:hypothetical protein
MAPLRKNEFVIIEKFNIAIAIADRVVLSYALSDGKIDNHTVGIIKEVSSELATLIEKNLHINLEDYGVSTRDEQVEIEMEDNGSHKVPSQKTI